MPRDYLAGLVGSAFVATKRNTRSVMYHSMAAMTDQSASIDFNVFGEPLVKLLKALGNKLSREWPTKYQNVTGARELFVMHLRIAHLTYRSALYLGGDIPADERRLPEFCVSLPVLNRAIL